MPNDDKRPPLPELRIELTCTTRRRGSVVEVRSAAEAMLLIEGAKELIEDHMVLIYLDRNRVVAGIDAFLHPVDELMKGEPSRALSRTITHFSGGNRAAQVIIVQALPHTERPDIASVDIRMLATLVAKMALFDIETVDCILMGSAAFFSYRESDGAWRALEEAVKPRLEFLGVEGDGT